MRPLTVLTCVVLLAAAAPPPPGPAVLLEDAATEQVRLKRRFADWRGKAALAEGEAGKKLKLALAEARNLDLDGRYEALIDVLLHKDVSRTPDLLTRGAKEAAAVREGVLKVAALCPKGDLADALTAVERDQRVIEGLITRVHRALVKALLGG